LDPSRATGARISKRVESHGIASQYMSIGIEDRHNWDESRVKELGLCAAGYSRRGLKVLNRGAKPCKATILAHLREVKAND
jgi:hypothetical protein